MRWWLLSSLLILALGTVDASSEQSAKSDLAGISPSEWPQITMINAIEYEDKAFPIAGCAFLIDTGTDTLAATAKHILTFFKAESMNGVSFAGKLKEWKMFPKSSQKDVVIVDRLINEDASEAIASVPSSRDWLIFTLKAVSPNIKPLRLRSTPLVPGEPVYIVGWRYSDKDCPQVIYEGAFKRVEDGTVLISTVLLADNTMPGLSGSPVIDADGFVIGLMSAKAGKLERLSGLAYAKKVLGDAGMVPAPD